MSAIDCPGHAHAIPVRRAEDLDELLQLADRLLVISGGHIVHEVPVAMAAQAEIGRHMVAEY